MSHRTDATENYRRHLYKTASLKINAGLKSLLNTLYESTLQTILPDNNEPNTSASPLKLSAPAKYERLALQLHQPISQYTLRLRRTNSQGQDVRFEQTLEIRMQHYEELIAAQTAKLAKLQKEWEVVVGEIWKLGVECLGENAVERLLFTEQRHNGPILLLSSSPSKTTDAGSTLFVPEYGTSPPKTKMRHTKKRVTFVEEKQDASDARDKYGASAITSFPSFLYQPSRYSNDALRAAGGVSEQQMHKLNQTIEGLGQKEMKDFRSIEKEHRAFWKKKTAQLASALREE
ncbi:uncharacterized protein SETTUDRAFT_85304 [Exserohilum turcica Et28A]|uniref:Uncharacterized protein n=1 Tax=Exserohilum turcicum (strain 28A) TaxID=671987 RepID=R0J607_EXST2|nr:uncharacterized protein SETTUDRAFT_85304 [Exserohilum turcica Et28A]EOA92345.1 hypothetical protein SETTUDRAFT_85304 [Exserohilum turcica Et28A]